MAPRTSGFVVLAPWPSLATIKKKAIEKHKKGFITYGTVGSWCCSWTVSSAGQGKGSPLKPSAHIHHTMMVMLSVS